jgi:hypothetical protein
MEFIMQGFGLWKSFRPKTGLWNSFSHNIFRKYLDIFVIIYLNDILIYSKTEREYKKYILKIFKKLINKNLRIKFEKTEFYAKKINFLIFIIDRKEIKTDKKKVQIILE